MNHGVLRPHDLVCLPDAWWAAGSATDWPAWLTQQVTQGGYAPFAVVRRALPRAGYVPIGIRGQNRAQRFATYVPQALVSEVKTARSVAAKGLWQGLTGSVRHRLLHDTLAQLVPDLTPFHWGIGGSVGFELLTQQPVIHAQSDLDIVIEAAQPFSPSLGQALITRCAEMKLVVDVQVQNELGAFHLEEYVRHPDRPILLKTAYGATLSDGLWPGMIGR